MTTEPETTSHRISPDAFLRLRRRIEPGSALWLFKRDRVAVASLTTIVFIIAAAITAQWITPYAAQGLGIPDTSSVFLGEFPTSIRHR